MKSSIVRSGITTGCLLVTMIGGVLGCKTSASSETKGTTGMNETYYKDGKFDSAKAKQAYFDLMTHFNVPIYAALQKDEGYLWPLDFGKGDFTSYGMGGVFWANEPDGYLGHEIYLLPFQSIPEHRHVPTQDKAGKPIPAKMESWQVRHGYAYGFSEVGQPNLDQFPEVKAKLPKLLLPYLKSLHVEKWEADGRTHKLAKVETWHFIMAGPEGAIISEYATFHDGAGLRFSVPGVKL